MTEQQDGAGGAEPAPEWIRQGPQAAETEPARARRRRLPLFWPLLILAAALAGGIVAAPYWVGLLPWAASGNDQSAAALAGIDHRLGEITQQQTALGERLARLEQHPADGGAAAEQEQAAALRQLADRVSALEQRPAAAAADATQLAPMSDAVKKLTDTVTDLGARIDKLEARRAAAAESRSGEALLLALGQLRAALDAGRPFGAELAAVRALAQNQPKLEATLGSLDGAANTGIPGTAALAQRFTQAVAPALLRIAAPAKSDGLGDRILARLRSLVVVHRIGNANDPIESAVEKAEAALGHNDLADAVEALAALPPHAQAPAADWLAAARQRLAAAGTLDRIAATVTADLAPPAAEH
jgi:hypothetical protein